MMMAILDTFNWLPFFAEPQNPDAFVFTFVLMLGVCVCDVGFSNTRQWLMVLQHPEQTATPLHTTTTIAPSASTKPIDISVFGEPYTWSNTQPPELVQPTTLTADQLSDKQVEEHFFVGGTFFGLPLSTTMFATKTTANSGNNPPPTK